MKSFKIGNIKIETPTALAPLAGITNLPFREICKACGCGVVYSEMISSNGLIYNSGKTFTMIETSEKEKPVAIQIFGYDPDIMAEAASIVEEKSGCDMIDINMGCSVKKILKSNSGSALMKDPDRTKKILDKVRKTIKIPLTIKIRSGWDNTGDDALYIAKLAEDCGVNAIAVHPRTAKQGFSGRADWSLIKKIKKAVSIPVIGNGDIVSADDAISMFEETGCDCVMIGRASMSNPFIFKEIKSKIIRDENFKEISIDEHFNLMKFYLESSINYLGEETACRMMRSRLAWFVKGLPCSTAFKEKIKKVSSKEEAESVIEEYLLLLKNRSIRNIQQ